MGNSRKFHCQWPFSIGYVTLITHISPKVTPRQATWPCPRSRRSATGAHQAAAADPGGHPRAAPARGKAVPGHCESWLGFLAWQFNIAMENRHIVAMENLNMSWLCLGSILLPFLEGHGDYSTDVEV